MCRWSVLYLEKEKDRKMEMVKITANMGNGKFEAYNVPFECRYFASQKLVEMGALSVKIGVAFVKAEELAEVA